MDLKFYLLQFSWADPCKVATIRQEAEGAGISYQHIPIGKGRVAPLKLIFTFIKGLFAIHLLIRRESITYVLPRSTMPALMVNLLLRFGLLKEKKIVFDADGFPLQERIDFLGRNPDSFLMKYLRNAEKTMLLSADRVMVRSKNGIHIHLENIKGLNPSKFFVVSNGRDSGFFSFDLEQRNQYRSKLNLGENDFLFVFTGTLGPEYEVEDMFRIFQEFAREETNSKFLILTQHSEFLQDKIPQRILQKIVIISPSFKDIPSYLSAGDIAFNLRKPAKSLRGISPIKLGEYLIMGLPVITSVGIGDSDDLLSDVPFCYLYKKDEETDLTKLIKWIEDTKFQNRENIRKFGLSHFSIEKSVKEYIDALSL